MDNDLLNPMEALTMELEALRDRDYPLFAAVQNLRTERPQYYHRDGTPFVSDDLMPDFLQWALIFEATDRHVAVTRTIYGERLSTVYLGMDHGFVGGKPLIFETMLFAPDDAPCPKLRLTITDLTPAERRSNEEREAYLAKHYPHHQRVQVRYATENEAKDRHEKLRLQCLIPPRWRHFLLWTIARDRDWSFYEDDEEDVWT